MLTELVARDHNTQSTFTGPPKNCSLPIAKLKYSFTGLTKKLPVFCIDCLKGIVQFYMTKVCTYDKGMTIQVIKFWTKNECRLLFGSRKKCQTYIFQMMF